MFGRSARGISGAQEWNAFRTRPVSWRWPRAAQPAEPQPACWRREFCAGFRREGAAAPGQDGGRASSAAAVTGSAACRGTRGSRPKEKRRGGRAAEPPASLPESRAALSPDAARARAAGLCANSCSCCWALASAAWHTDHTELRRFSRKQWHFNFIRSLLFSSLILKRLFLFLPTKIYRGAANPIFSFSFLCLSLGSQSCTAATWSLQIVPVHVLVVLIAISFSIEYDDSVAQGYCVLLRLSQVHDEVILNSTGRAGNQRSGF